MIRDQFYANYISTLNFVFFIIRKLRNTVFFLRAIFEFKIQDFFTVILKGCILVQNTVNFIQIEYFFIKIH